MMKLSKDAREAIHGWRWGPYINDPIERQQRDDMLIKKIMDTFNQLESENEMLKRLAWLVIDADKKVGEHIWTLREALLATPEDTPISDIPASP